MYINELIDLYLLSIYVFITYLCIYSTVLDGSYTSCLLLPINYFPQ